MKMELEKRKCSWPLLLQGLTSVCVGTTLLIYSEGLTDILYEHVLFLGPSSLILEEWSNPSRNMEVKVYYFNWTNPEKFKDRFIKPKFEEIGPYFFSQESHKVDISFNDNFTITYRNNKTFYFDEKQSAGSVDDEITSLNVIPVVAVDRARNWNFFLKKGLSIALNGVPYETTKKLGELMFNGYEDHLLTTKKYLPFMNDIPDMDKFAWFYKRNGSKYFEGVFTVGSGLKNTSLSTVYNWNYKNEGLYPEKCSDINVPTEFFPQRLKKDKVEFFIADFCRKITLDFNKTLTYEGMEAHKFTAGVSFLDSGTVNPDNSCLCSRKCRKYGVIDYSKCKFGTPTYLSLPHFSKADPSFRNEVEGMMPDQKNHETYIIINPRTGVVLELNTAIQVNMLVQPNSGIRTYADVPEIMFPIFWFSIQMKLPDSAIIKIKLLEYMPAILKFFSAFLVLVGMISLVYFLHRRLIKNPRRIRNDHDRLGDESKPLNTRRNFERP